MQSNNNLLLAQSPSGKVMATQSKPWIMVVDNERAIREAHPLCNPLVECGYQVKHVVNAHEALRQLKMAEQVLPSLVICDLFLNEMDGLDFVQELRKAQHNTAQKTIPVLLVATIESNPTFEQAVLSMGADDFIVKPVRSSDLLLRVRRLMRGLPGILVEKLENQRLEHKRGKELEAVSVEEESPFRGLRRSEFDLE